MEIKNQDETPSILIPHNHVDLVMKTLGNEYNNKSFAAYGLNLPKIINFKLTELLVIEANDRFADHIFDLEDGSHAIDDYDSRYKKKNFLKYGDFALRVLHREMEDDKEYKLRIIVIYIDEVPSAPFNFKTDRIEIMIEQAFLSHIETGI